MDVDAHWNLFADFCRHEKATGGPDPQIAMIVGMSEGLPLAERIWHVGCYGGVYNVGGAMALAHGLTRDDVLSMPDGALTNWLVKHWEGIPFRRERRAVRTPHKLGAYLRSYALASRDWPDRDWWLARSTPRSYEIAWTDVLSVYGVGRYIAIKLLEAFSRLGAGTAAYDIRALDAWSPRLTLAMLWPDLADAINNDKTKRGAGLVESVADDTIARLAIDFGLTVSHFELQVMTCEYRESIVSRRQYPGRSHDSEDKYLRAISRTWPASLVERGYAIRKALFPARCLGELSGWQGVRDILGEVAATHKYMWSDLLYDYVATTDFASPVRHA